MGEPATIDVHSHILKEEWFEGTRRDYKAYIPRFVKQSRDLYIIKADQPPLNLIQIPDTISKEGKRLKALDAMKIDLQVIAPMPLFFFYRAPTAAGVELNRIQNDGIAQSVRDGDGRFLGMCSVPLQDPKAAVAELRRATKKLGLRGVEIGTNVAGKNLDDRSLWPFYEAAQELGTPIMIHPMDVVGKDRLAKYYLGNFIGNPLETTIAAASLIFGGVLDAFPRLKFYLVHGGGFLPYQIWRFDHGYGVRPEAKTCAHRPSYYLKMLHIDTMLFDPRTIEYLIRLQTPDRVVLGTDYPFDMADRKMISVMRRVSITREGMLKILNRNAARLFDIR